MKFNILSVTLIAILGSCMVDVVYPAAVETDIVCPFEQKDDSFVVQYASKVSCNIFYKCNRGVAIKVECSDGLHYNERIQACDYPGRANCKLNMAESLVEVPDLKLQEGEQPEEVIIEARSLLGPKTEDQSKSTLEEEHGNKIPVSQRPKLPQSNNNNKKLESSDETEIEEKTETHFPKLPQINTNGSLELQESVLKPNSSTNASKDKDIIKQSEKPNKAEEPKKVKAPLIPIADTEGNSILSKELRATTEKVLKKPNKEPSSAIEEDKKEESKDEMDKKDNGENTERKDKDKEKLDIKKDEEVEKNDIQKNDIKTDAGDLSVESEESIEDTHEKNTSVDEYHPKPIRRATSHESERNSGETLNNTIEEKKKVTISSNKNSKENKTPVDTGNVLKKPIQ